MNKDDAEKVLFSVAFAYAWMKNRETANPPPPQSSNEDITRDEGQHISFATFLYQDEKTKENEE